MRTFRRHVLHTQIGGKLARLDLNLPAIELGILVIIHIFGRELVVALGRPREPSASVCQVEQLLNRKRFDSAPDRRQLRAELPRHAVPLDEWFFVQQFLAQWFDLHHPIFVASEVLAGSLPSDHSYFRSAFTTGVVFFSLCPALDCFSDCCGLSGEIMRVIRQLLISIAEAVERLMLV